MTGKPIKFVSMGEKPDSLEPFYPDRMAKRILGMGDVVGIIEKAQRRPTPSSSRLPSACCAKGFTMNDMLDQMKAVKKMGGMKGILGMLPGGQRALNQMGGNLDEGHLRQERGHHHVDDQGGAPASLHHQRPAPRPYRQGRRA